WWVTAVGREVLFLQPGDRAVRLDEDQWGALDAVGHGEAPGGGLHRDSVENPPRERVADEHYVGAVFARFVIGDHVACEPFVTDHTARVLAGLDAVDAETGD